MNVMRFVNRPSLTSGILPAKSNETKAVSSPSVILDIEGVSLAYRDGPLVIQDAHLTVHHGEFVALVGPSGCGKTTLLNMVAGFLKATAGSILLDGKPIERPGSDRTMVFQDDAVFPWYTVEQNVAYGIRFVLSNQERRRRVAELIKLVGLTGRESAYPRELSGGMRKRVDVARALAPEPRLLLMDEPFAALDVMTKARLQEEFLQLWQLSDMTVLFVTHDIEEALYLSDRVVTMSINPGRLGASVPVPFERPRPAALRTSAAFQDLRQQVIELINASASGERSS
jgi:NitT/TauT family transport system ATP-binding protein